MSWRSNNSSATDHRDEKLARAEIYVLSCIFLSVVSGNGIVLTLLISRRGRHILTNIKLLIMHLSLADLFVAFFNVLPQLAWDVTFRFQGPDSLCCLVKYFRVFILIYFCWHGKKFQSPQVVAMFASSYILVATAFDRYVAVCHPLVSHTIGRKRVYFLIFIAWVISLIFSGEHFCNNSN